MLTTVLSMKAMPEPRIVAARIQRLACAVHGTSAFVERITASSHGGFMAVIDSFEWIRIGPCVKNTSVPQKAVPKSPRRETICRGFLKN